MPIVNLSLQVVPAVISEEIYPLVDKAIAVIARSGVKYEVGPMETVMEGELDTLLHVAREAVEAVAEGGAQRMLVYIKIDYAAGGVTIDEKVGKYRQG